MRCCAGSAVIADCGLSADIHGACLTSPQLNVELMMLGELGDKLGIKDVPTVITVVKMRLGSSVDSVKLHTYRLTDWP